MLLEAEHSPNGSSAVTVAASTRATTLTTTTIATLLTAILSDGLRSVVITTSVSVAESCVQLSAVVGMT
jgi:hypothetical protein